MRSRSQEFITRELWGMGNSSCFMHYGKFTLCAKPFWRTAGSRGNLGGCDAYEGSPGEQAGLIFGVIILACGTNSTADVAVNNTRACEKY